MSDELYEFQTRHGIPTKAIGADQHDIILRYILIKCQIGDLFCQRTMIEEFALAYIKQNEDGNHLAKVYIDFINAVDFLQSLEKAKLEVVDEGAIYLKEFTLSQLKNCLYLYPEEASEDSRSQATSYNMFGGFHASVKDNCSVQSNARLTSRTSNQLKLVSMSRVSNQSSGKMQKDLFLSNSIGASRFSLPHAKQPFGSKLQNNVLAQSKFSRFGQTEKKLMDSIQEGNSSHLSLANSINQN